MATPELLIPSIIHYAKFCGKQLRSLFWHNLFLWMGVYNCCKVKRGNLERKSDFCICCLRKFCSKSEIMFVWEAHLSTVKASKSCLTLLFYLGRTADQLLRVQKLKGAWSNLERFLFGHVATVILHENYGNTSIELLLDVRLFICL